MLLRSKSYDLILQLSTIIFGHNKKLQRYRADFPSLSSTNYDFELTLTLVINTDFLSVPKTRIVSDLFWIVKREISVVFTVYKASKMKLHQSTATSTLWCLP